MKPNPTTTGRLWIWLQEHPATLSGIAVYILLVSGAFIALSRAPITTRLILLLPALAALAVALYVARLRDWKRIALRRSVFLLQAAGLLLIVSPMAAITTSFAVHAGVLGEPQEPSAIFTLLSRTDAASGITAVIPALAGILALWLAAHLTQNGRTATNAPTSRCTNPPADSARPEVGIELRPLPQSKIRKALHFASYESDLPPEVPYWAGRLDQLHTLAEGEACVVALTGIGGQGKSALASKFLEHWREQNPQDFWDWRDCREHGERFPTQLASILTRITLGEMNTTELSTRTFNSLSSVFFRLVRNSKGLIILDNVDHYVDASSEQFTGHLHAFVATALRARTDFRILLTCRPRVTYGVPEFQHISLDGLSKQDTIDLFRQRGIQESEASNQEIEDISVLTGGHPFWLNILSSQIERRAGTAKLVLAQLRDGGGNTDRIASMLRPIWAVSAPREKSVLLLLSEANRALDENTMAELIKPEIKSYNQFSRALRAVIAHGLVSKKSSPGLDSTYELHPVVRQFLRSFIARDDRMRVIRMIAAGTTRFIATIRDAPGVTSISLQTVEMAIVNIEQCIESGASTEAMAALHDVARAFIGGGILQEYTRLCKQILQSARWEFLSEETPESVHGFVCSAICHLAEAGEEKASRDLVRKYAPHIPKDSASVISWHEHRCRMEWLLGQFSDAINEGRQGVALKEKSDVDTAADASFNLGLALRDAGQIQEALDIFLRGTQIDDLLREDYRTNRRNHAVYGNIGRCLQLQGESPIALRMFARSWLLLDDLLDSPLKSENLGWGGLWIAQLLLEQESHLKAADFLAVARDSWSLRLPLKLPLVADLKARLPLDVEIPPPEQNGASRRHCREEMNASL